MVLVAEQDPVANAMLKVRRRFTTVPKPKAIIQIPNDAATNTAQGYG
jgi:hypothetical protein